MTTQITTSEFDYSHLDKDTASKLRYYANSGHGLVRKNQIRFIAEFGEMLSDARNLLSNHDNGTFCKWAVAEFDLSKQTVYNYVNAWDKCLSNGWTTMANISPTALYLMSHDDTPKSVLTKVLRIAVKKETVTKADVNKLIPGTNLSGGKPRKPKPPAPVTTEESGDASGSNDAPEAPEPDYGKCPNCAGTKWKVDNDDYVSCAKCSHPHGEPAGDADEDRIKTQRQKTTKTIEALMRAFDDLQTMKARQFHAGTTTWTDADVMATLESMGTIRACKGLLKIAKGWM